MKENLKPIYVWVELPKSSIPHQFRDVLKNYLKDNNSDQDVIDGFQVFDINQDCYFIRIKAFYENRKFRFTCFTGGWFHLSYRLYLEVDLSRNIMSSPFPNEIELKEVDNYLLTEISILYENKVIIEGKDYFMRFSRVFPSQDCFEFVPIRKANIIEFFKKILFS